MRNASSPAVWGCGAILFVGLFVGLFVDLFIVQFAVCFNVFVGLFALSLIESSIASSRWVIVLMRHGFLCGLLAVPRFIWLINYSIFYQKLHPPCMSLFNFLSKLHPPCMSLFNFIRIVSVYYSFTIRLLFVYCSFIAP